MEKDLSVIVWSKEGCHYCEEVKQYLNKREIKYQTVDVTNHDERRDILEVKYGVRHVPIVEVGNGPVYIGVTELGLEHLEIVLNRAQR
ncbi:MULTISPECIES: glutaredoxin family protein [Bacillaceae]|uniref:Glutaredoxin n=1 Tax=Peribacillus huizhouensis TaxID=1501239 RepID=A0ABR6CN14_9BACI|nr:MULTISPECIES: glutaredoxin family protein [Bacillaceae]MBA9026416.1 glutaredoxin [Peribacillus huizhouensis]